MIEIKHFRLLKAIQENGSLTAAAGILQISQPAASQQLQGAEASIGTPLTVRTGQGSRLTEAGQALLSHGESILATLEIALHELSAIAALRAGHIRISTFRSAIPPLVGPVLGSLNTQAPELQITLIEAEPPQQLSMLRAGEVDIGILFGFSNNEIFSSPDLTFVPLLNETTSVAVSLNHPLAMARHVTLMDLQDEKWIAGCPGCRGELLELCLLAGFAPNITFETDDYVAIQTLVANALGVALATQLQTASIAVPGLAIVPLDAAPLRRMVAAVPNKLIGNIAIQQFLKSLTRQSQALVSRGKALPVSTGANLSP